MGDDGDWEREGVMLQIMKSIKKNGIMSWVDRRTRHHSQGNFAV
jgi:hypothetical protein